MSLPNMSIGIDNDLFSDNISSKIKVARLIIIVFHELAHLKIGWLIYKIKKKFQLTNFIHYINCN